MVQNKILFVRGGKGKTIFQSKEKILLNNANKNIKILIFFYLDLANEGLDQYAESIIKRVLKTGKLLTHSEIQEIIDNVNDQYSQDIQRLDLINFCLTYTYLRI